MYSKISFLSFCMAFICIVLGLINEYISGYAFYDASTVLETLGSFVPGGIVVSCMISVVIGLISVFRKDTNKILPTISFSFGGTILFFFLFILVAEMFVVRHIEKGVITNYGVFDIPVKKSDSTSTERLYEHRYLVLNTDEITASKDLAFGFNYVISGEPDDGVVDIMKITKYPEPGMVRNNQTIHADTIEFSVALNELRYSGFRFDYDYELIPGNWEFEFWYKENKLLSKIFKVSVDSLTLIKLRPKSTRLTASPPNQLSKMTDASSNS